MSESDRLNISNELVEWIDLPAEPIPSPTYWPALLALGTTFFAWGFVTTFIISGVGLVLFSVALIGWIGEIRYDES